MNVPRLLLAAFVLYLVGTALWLIGSGVLGVVHHVQSANRDCTGRPVIPSIHVRDPQTGLLHEDPNLNMDRDYFPAVEAARTWDHSHPGC